MQQTKSLWEDPKVVFHSKIVSDSYKFWAAKEILGVKLSGVELAKALYLAPFVLVSHGQEEDPIFNYANQKAQILWENNWNEFTNMPSRLSAEPVEKAAREVLLTQGRKAGVTFNYTGVRISKTGKRFLIKDVMLFNLLDSMNNYVGQAALFSDWEFL